MGHYLSLRPKYQTKSLQLLLKLMSPKQIRHEWRRSLGRYNNRHGANAESVINFVLRLPMSWDDRSETWFMTFCILIRPQTLV